MNSNVGTSGTTFSRLTSPMATTNETLRLDSEIRSLPPNIIRQLSLILDNGSFWQDLALCVKKPDSDELLFTSYDVEILEKQRSPTSELLKHWSTMGKTKRPKVDDLVNALIIAKLYRAADYLLVDVLKGNPAPRLGEPNPTDICKHLNDELDVRDDSTTLNAGPSGFATFVENEDTLARLPEIPHYPYAYLEQITSNFDRINVLGEGAFGTVYLGKEKYGRDLAVKKLKMAIAKQFVTELEIMYKFPYHENILPLLGYSFDGPQPCLIYAYMCNGSLQDRLACLNNTPPIPWLKRVSIAIGIAKGLCHLHTSGDEPFVHRDIKTANILLDENMVPKIGDFGLMRIGNPTLSRSVVVTETVLGTPAYMAQEALRGDVSVKLDTFSYGIVIFELISALPVYDESRKEPDLLTYIQEEALQLLDLLDRNAGEWNLNIAESLFQLAIKCTEHSKRHRPVMPEVLHQLEQLLVT